MEGPGAPLQGGDASPQGTRAASTAPPSSSGQKGALQVGGPGEAFRSVDRCTQSAE